tara:strand:- start:50 stop:664 length:615 start_codon:yes stop_codon:yes gene_type:complete
MDATTIARVKALLDITSSTHDTVLTSIVASVSKRFESYLDRKLLAEARTQEYNIRPRQNKLFLREYPVSAIASIKIALDWDYASAIAVSASDYHVTSDTGTVHFTFNPITSYGGSNYAYAPDAIQVVYTAGFATSTANLITNYPDIAMAADLQSVAMWRRRDTPQGNSISVGGSSISYENPLDLVPDVIHALSPHRRLRFAANG